MVRGIKTRDAIIVGAVVAVLVLGVIGYFVFFRSNGGGGDGNGDDEPVNTRPVADAGYDQTIRSGEEFDLSGQSSYDSDGDDLFYFWDMDAGVDSNSDGVNDNDKDFVGMEISYIYPSAFETITYIVTLTVADGDMNNEHTLTDTDTVRVTILVNESGGEIPEVTLSCNYQPGVSFPTVIEAHFLVTVESVTSYEMISNFSYRLEDADGGIIMNGSVPDIVVVPPNATIRFIDGPEVTKLGEGDTFSIKEEGVIEEGCWFYLYYKNKPEKDPELVGEIELTQN